MSGFISTDGYYRKSSDMCFYFRVTKGQSYRYQSTGNRSIGAIFDSVPTENQTKCIDGTLFNPLPKQSAFVAPASGIMVIYTNLNFSQKVMDSFQVEKGTEATSVVPHKEQVFTFPLGNEKLMLGDYLADDGIHHVRGQVMFDGTENWLAYATGNTENYNCFTIRLETPFKKSNNQYLLINAFSNYFKEVAWIYIYNSSLKQDKPAFGFTIDNNRYVYIKVKNTILTAQDLKTWLAQKYANNSPVIIEYPLNEETIVPYTSAQQEVYNQIKNAYSYDEMTIITGSSDGNKPFFTVQTYKDLNKELNNKVDKVQGKELSSNDFTDTLKEKLEGLENYDDTEIKADISDIQDEQTEQNTDIEKLQTENARFKATLPTTTGEGQDVTLNKTAELEFKKPPLPMGNSEQESTEGRQLLPYPYADTTKTTSGITFTDNGDGSITINGTSTAESTFFLLGGWSTTNNIPDNMKKTISIKASGTNNVVIQASLKDENGNSVTNTLYGNNDTRSADVSTAVSGYIRIVLPSGVTMNNVVVKPYIVEGTYTTATFPEYEPYTGGEASPNPDYPQEITNVTGDVEVKVQNKNLFDNILSNSINKTNCTISYDNGEIVLNATGTDAYIGEFRSVGSSYNAICGQLIKVKPNTKYTVQNTNPLFNKNFINYWNKDKTVTKQIELMGGSSTRTFTTEFNTEYITFRTGYAQTVSGQQYKFNITVIEGDYTSVTIPSYTPHKEQTFTFPLGNEKLMLGDYLADDGIHHVRGQVVLDGTETWALMGSTETYYEFQFTNLNPRAKNEYTFPISSHFSNKANNRIVAKYNNLLVRVPIEANITTVQEFKTWLSNNNVTVEYILEEEVIIPYTSAQQEVYNQIKQALSYEEQTNISSNTIALFNVEAYQDIKEKIEEAGGHTHNNKAVLDGISSADITRWNNKSDFSGDYNDLSNKPTIPDVSGFITKDVNNLTNYTLKTNTGSLIDLEINNTTYVVTMKLKDVDGNVISTDTIDLPLETVVVSGRYDNTTKKVILTLENGSEVDFSVADLVAGLQTEITSSNKLASDLVDDTNSGNKFVTTSEKQTWNGKYDKPSTGIPKADLASDVQTSLGKADTALQSHQDISGKANKISVVQTSTSTIEINSNTFYKFGEVASLTITLASITDNTIYNEYMFEFVSGSTATTLTLPSSIKWLETPTIDANKIYQCSIVDNVGLLVGVANV